MTQSTDEGTSGTSNAHYDNSYEIVVSGNVPMVDGASFGLGYATADTYLTSRGDREEGTAYVNYSYGPLSKLVHKLVLYHLISKHKQMVLQMLSGTKTRIMVYHTR